jgi:hypothetical protein
MQATGVEFNTGKVADSAEMTGADTDGVEHLMEAGEKRKRCWANPSPIEHCHIQSLFHFIFSLKKCWLLIQIIWD